MTILIFSGYADWHTDVVVDRLDHLGAEYIRVNAGDIGDELTVDWDLTNGMQFESWTRGMKVDNVRALWNRRFVPKRLNPDELPKSAGRFIHQEERRWFDELQRSLDHVPAINDRHHNDRADSRILHLTAARDLGLDVPDTIISQRPEFVRQFIAENPDLVVKALQVDGAHFDNQWIFAQTRRCDLSLLTDEVIAAAPSIYQAIVPKIQDVRAVVVGDQVFCGALAFEEGDPVDVRNAVGLPEDGAPTRSYSSATLPQEVNDQLLALTRKLGLEYCSADLVQGTDGTYYFIDLNPGGQFYWIEDEADQPISQAIAERLVELAGAAA